MVGEGNPPSLIHCYSYAVLNLSRRCTKTPIQKTKEQFHSLQLVVWMYITLFPRSVHLMLKDCFQPQQNSCKWLGCGPNNLTILCACVVYMERCAIWSAFYKTSSDRLSVEYVCLRTAVGLWQHALSVINDAALEESCSWLCTGILWTYAAY